MATREVTVKNPGLPFSRKINTAGGSGETYSMPADVAVTGEVTPSGGLGGAALATGAGVGITAGVGTVISSEITKVGKKITTEVYIDLTGLHSATTLLDIIGVEGVGVAFLGQIITAESGALYAGTMRCLEAPLTGVNDIDLYSAVEATGVEDTGIALLTQTALLGAASAWTLNEVQALTALPAANEYLYLCVGVAGTVGVYTAGKFLITLEGYEA